jgi:uncharacterized protein YkwD
VYGRRQHAVARVLLVATGALAALGVAACAPLASDTCTVGGRFSATTAARRDPNFEAALFAQHNLDRAAQRLAPLTYDPQLADAAAAYATKEAAQGRWGHACNLFAYAAASVRVVDENLALSRNEDAGALNAMFMASPAHRANILDTRVHNIGIGVLQLPDGTTLTVVRLADS